MNIQDLISTIINYVKNMDKKDLVIFSLIFYLVIKTRNIEGTENVTAIDDSTLNSSHLAAIRNLGNFAKELQSGNDIVLPGNVKIEGKLDVETTGGNIKAGNIKAENILGDTVTINGDTNAGYTFKTKGTSLTLSYNGTEDERLVLHYHSGLEIKGSGGIRATSIRFNGDTHAGYTLKTKGTSFHAIYNNKDTDEQFIIHHNGGGSIGGGNIVKYNDAFKIRRGKHALSGRHCDDNNCDAWWISNPDQFPSMTLQKA